MKPLVLFSSLAVLCAGGLMALSYKGLQDDPSALTSLSSGSQTIKINPAEAVSTPPATQQSAETKTAPAEKAEEKVAVVAPEPEKVETAPSAETAPVAKLGDDTAKPEAAEAEPEGASFDIVRVEEDGSAVLAGRAEPGATVRLLINEKVAGETQANDRGEWVVIPAEPMPAGAHQMQIQTENAAGEIKLAEQSVALTVPDQPGTQPLIVLSETAKPSKVLQKPEAAEVKQAEAAPESTTSKSAEDSTAAGQQPAAESKTAALEPPATATAPEPTSTARRLTVDVVDYNEAGLTTFSGRSAPDSRVRVYVDNRFTGETVAGSDGAWSFTAGREIASGPHTLRTDELASDGNVKERIEMPFFRESAERIASLQAQRKTEAEEEQAKPEATTTAAVEPETKTTATEDPDATAKVAAADTQAASTGTEAPTGSEAPAADDTKAADGVKTAEETQAAEKPEVAEAQPTSEAKGDAETVKADVAPAAAEPDATQQTAAVEPSVEPAKPETVQPVAESDAATEPAKPDTSQQQVAAVEPDAEPAKPADLIPGTEDDEPTADAAKPEPEAAATETAAVTTETQQVATAPPATGKVVIQPGNNLWQISRVIYGKGRQYTVIYDANKDQIRDPDRIYPGQIFETPGSDAPESIDPACKRPLAECN
ncbi:LysM peptidoglycan-binding domain-containing protein [Anderseniella sp. Alg231-50]|uniref:LysM peptidoglycan-binding domain-containing protein n=1 Tax=Anderseniella sp. Alg231-50 TaxID=1922226 RepID=UPI000D54BD7E